MPLRIVPPRGGKSPFYTVRGTFAGRTVDATTKARNQEGAEKFKAGLELELTKQEADRFVPPVTFKQAAQLYLEYRDPKKRDRAYIEKVVAMLGKYELRELKPHMLVDAANKLYPGSAGSTRNRNAVTPIGAVMHYAAENGLCPYVRMKKFKEKEPEPRWVSMDIARVLIANSEGPMRLALTWLFCQGWRISDVLRVQHSHIDRKAATVRRHIAKTDKWRLTPLHADVLLLLADEPRELGPLFPWRNKEEFYVDLRPLCDRLKIRFTPHMARHSFATWRINAGVSPQEIMEAGGWEKITSVMRYAKLDATRIRSAVDKVKL